MKKLLLIMLTFVFGLTLISCDDAVSDEIDYLTVEQLIEMAKNNTSSSDKEEIKVTGTPNFVVPENASKVLADAGAITIKFSHTMGEALRTELDKGIARFNQIYPNIKIVHEQVGGYDDVRDTIAMQLTAKKEPNIAYCYPDHVALYNLSGSVVTLDNLINSTQTITSGSHTETLGLTQAQIDNFIPGYYNEGREFGDGLMYTLPFSKSTEVLYYNKTFFDANNLEVPTHWFSESADDKTSMEYVCSKIKELDPTSIPLGYDSEANWFITMCEQIGSDYTTNDGDENFLFNNNVNKTFCREFRRWYQAGYLTTQEIFGEYTSNLFKRVAKDESKSYMSIGSSAGATHQRPEKVDGEYPFEVGIAAIPQMNQNNPRVISQGPSICIFKKANAAEVIASWLFVKFLTTDVQFQASFSIASGYVPVIQSVSQNSVYKGKLDAADGYDNIAMLSAKKCLEMKDAYYTSPAFNGSSKARDEVGLIMQAVLAGKADDDSALNILINRAFRDAITKCKAAQ